MPPHTHTSSPNDANVIISSWRHISTLITPESHQASISDEASQTEGSMWTHFFSVSRRTVTPVLLFYLKCWQVFLTERTRSATKAWLRLPDLNRRASQGGSWGVHQVAVTWLSGGESWEFIPGQQTTTSQSLNLQMPPNATQMMKLTMVWNWMPVASVKRGSPCCVRRTTITKTNKRV